MRKVLLSGLCLLFTGLSFAQSHHVIQFDNITQVRQYDLFYTGNDFLHAGTAVNNQQQPVVWLAKTNANHGLVWVKSFPMTVNSNGMEFLHLNYSVDIEGCNQSDDFMLSVKRIDYSTFRTFIDVLKLNVNAELIWGRRVSFETTESGFGVNRSNKMLVLGNDAVVVSNGCKTGLFVCKLSSQGASQLSKRISTSETAIEDGGNGGWAISTASDGGFYASFQKDEHPVMAKLDGQFNTVSVNEWSSLEQSRINAVTQLNGAFLFGGTSIGTDFFGYASTDLSFALISEFPDMGTADLFDFDHSMPLPGRFFVETSHNYKLIDMATNGYSVHHTPNPFTDFNAHIQLYGNDSPFRKAIYFTTGNNGYSTAYTEEFDLMEPQCVEHSSQEFSLIALEIPDSSILHPALFKEDFGAFTTYSPSITALSGTISESCFLETAENNPFDFEMYPNPMQSGTVLSFPENTPEAEHIVFTDLQGKVVAEMPFLQEIQLPESLTAGMYFITLLTKNADHQSTKKLLIQ